MNIYALRTQDTALLVLINDLLNDLLVYCTFDMPEDVREETEELQEKLQRLLMLLEDTKINNDLLKSS